MKIFNLINNRFQLMILSRLYFDITLLIITNQLLRRLSGNSLFKKLLSLTLNNLLSLTLTQTNCILFSLHYYTWLLISIYKVQKVKALMVYLLARWKLWRHFLNLPVYFQIDKRNRTYFNLNNYYLMKSLFLILNYKW